MAGPAVAALVITTLVAPASSSPAAAAVPDCATAHIDVQSLGGPNFYIDGSNPSTFHSSYTGYRFTNNSMTPLDDVWVKLSDFTGGSLALASNQSAALRLGSFDTGAGSARSLFWYLTAAGESNTAQQHVVTVYSHDPSLANSSALCTTTDGFKLVDTSTNANPNKVNSISVAGEAPHLGARFTVTITGSTGSIGAGPTNEDYSMWMSPSVSDTWPVGAFRLVNTSLALPLKDADVGTRSIPPTITTLHDILRVSQLGSSDRDYTATYTFQTVGFTSSSTPVKPVQEITSGTQIKYTGAYPSDTFPVIQQPVDDLKLGLSGSVTELDTGGGTVHLTAPMTGSAGAELDSFVLTAPSGATVTPGSVTWNGQPMPDPVLRDATLVFPGPFVMPGGPVSLDFDVALDATTGERDFSLLGAVGPSYIGTSTDRVDGSDPATFSVTVDTQPTAADTTITTDGTASVDTASLVADADGDPLAVHVTGAPAHGSTSVAGGVIGYTPAAGYVGPDSFGYTVTDGRGGSATGTVTVTVVAAPTPQAQSIDWTAPTALQVGGTTTLTATATSDLPVTFTDSTPAVCTLAGDQVTAVAAGACILSAHQPGDDTWAAAPSVDRTVTITTAPVTPEPQTITWAQPSGLHVDDTLALAGTASSGLAVAYASETTDVCTVSGSTLTAVAAGTCQVTARQPGDSAWEAAPPVQHSLAVTRRGQAISFTLPTGLHVDDTFTLNGSADSGLGIDYTSATTGVCTVSGADVTTVAAGTCTITATQAGDSAWAAATDVVRSTPVAGKAQAITWTMPTGLHVGDTATLSATTSSGLPVTFTSSTPAVCSVVGSTLTAVGAGGCTVTATQPGDEAWAMATPVDRSTTVDRNGQVITWAQPADLGVGGTESLSAGATSHLPVTFTSTTGSVCAVDGTTLTALTAGDCTLTAGQPGDDTWAPATSVERTLAVTVAPVGLLPQTITWDQPADLVIDETADLAATATSTLDVALASTTEDVCTVSGATVTAVAAGTCTLAASQAGNATWAPATGVTRTLTVTRKPQGVTLALPAGLQAGQTAALTATADSGLPVVLTSTTPATCTVDGTTLTAVAAGDCTVTARQAGDDTWAAATPVDRTTSITAAPPQDPDQPYVPAPVAQTITFEAPAVLVTGGSPVGLTVDSSSGLPVTLAVVDGACTLGGEQVWAGADTDCDVRASQAGGPGFAAAPEVTREIRFVSPVDDDVAMGSPLDGPASTDIDPLANDPAGLALSSVDQPAHGSVDTAADGTVRYTPARTFHGADSFTYRVVDPLGRSASAVVRVQVADAPPTIEGAGARQLAGTTTDLPLHASDPNGDAVTVTADTDEPGVTARVEGDVLRVSTDASVSGVVRVALTADDGYGGVTTAPVRLLVRPRPVLRAGRVLSGSQTVVSWTAAPTTSAHYAVLVDGATACTTTRPECDLDQVLGPDFRVRVRVLGRDSTVSTRTAAEPRGHHQVLLETVYFDSGEHVLARDQMHRLRAVAHEIRSLGFHDSHVSGYTDSDGGAAYNLELSRQRTRMVSRTLRRVAAVRSAEAWFGYDDPVASNDSAAGKALNRRVEILVSY